MTTDDAPATPPMPDLTDALARANAYVADDGMSVDEDTILANPLQGLYIMSYVPDDSSATLDGGGLVVTDDDVYDLPSAPGQPEYDGVVWPEDPDNPEEDDDEDDDDLTDADMARLADLFGDDEVARDVALFGGDEAFMFDPASPDSSAPAKRAPGGRKGPSYPTRMKPTATGDWDPQEHPRAGSGTSKGGRFIPKKGGAGGGGGGGKAAPKSSGGGTSGGGKSKPPKESRSERVQHLVEGVLKALGPLMAELSGPQVQALMEKIKKNAEAFINGQANAPHHGGGGHKGGGAGTGGHKGVGAPGATGAPGTKKGGSSGGSSGSPGTGGGHDASPAQVRAIVNGLKSLLAGFGHDMKPEQREKLKEALDGLTGKGGGISGGHGSAASRSTSLANVESSPDDPSICVMAIPHPDALANYVGPEEKHATLTYFGQPSDSADPDRLAGSKALFQNCLAIAASGQAPFTADVSGVDSLGDGGAQVWLLDSPELQSLFEALGGGDSIDSELDSMYQDAGVTRYPDYTPHVTIGYQGSDDEPETDPEDMDAAQDITAIPFDRLALWWGDERHEYPLTGGDGLAASPPGSPPVDGEES